MHLFKFRLAFKVFVRPQLAEYFYSKDENQKETSSDIEGAKDEN